MKFLLFGVLLLAVAKNGLSLKCYFCEGTDITCQGNVKDCAATTANPHCIKMIGEKNSKKANMKDCISVPGDEKINKCEDGEFGGIKGTKCLCNKDECNEAHVTMMSKLIIVSLVSAAIFMQKLT